MEIIQINSNDNCVFNYGYDGSNNRISGNELILQHDDLLSTIDKHPGITYSFVWSGVEPGSDLIKDLAGFLVNAQNTTSAPKYLNKLSIEDIIAINKRRPKFVQEEFANIFGNLNELDSNKAAEAFDIVKDSIKDYNLNNVKPEKNKFISVDVNGIRRQGKIEYGRAGDGSIKINFDIRLALSDLEDDKPKAKDGWVDVTKYLEDYKPEVVSGIFIKRLGTLEQCVSNMDELNQYIQEGINKQNGEFLPSIAIVKSIPTQVIDNMTYGCGSKIIVCNAYDGLTAFNSGSGSKVSLEDYFNEMNSEDYYSKKILPLEVYICRSDS